MSRYKLGKAQINRLLEDKPVMDGHGRKFYASDKTKECLQMIYNHNLYDKFDVIVEDGVLDIVKKVGGFNDSTGSEKSNRI